MNRLNSSRCSRWFGLTVGLWLLSSSLLPLAAAAQSRPAVVQQGYTLLDRGWVNDAIRAFRRALQSYPQSTDARLGLAIAYQRAGEDENAWQTYRQLLAQDPTNRRALEAVGLLGSYRPEWQPTGIDALTQLLNLDPNNLSARTQRALLYGYQGQFVEAIADYELVLANNPTADAILGAAQIYTYSGDFANGLALFERYQAGGRAIPETAITAYALALQETGNAEQAIAILEPRLRNHNTLDAVGIQLRASLAAAYQANQQPDVAQTLLDPLRNNAAATLPLARVLSAIGRQSRDRQLYSEAVTLYRQVLDQTPSPSVGLLTEVADVWSEDPSAQADALRLYDDLSTNQPDNLSLSVKRLILQSELGQLSRDELRQQLTQRLQPLPPTLAEQRAIAQALVRLDPPDPELLPIYRSLSETNTPFLQFRIAQIALQQGDFAAARAALARYSDSPAAANDIAPELLLAEIERQEGDLDASARRYQALLTTVQTADAQQQVLQGLIGIRIAQEQFTEAIALYDQLLALDPNNLNTQVGRASLAYRTGQMSVEAADALLDQWLATYPNTAPTPELLSLVEVLPPDPARRSLYETLLAADPDRLVLNLRLVQAIAPQDPVAATELVNQLIARNPDDLNVYFVQGELAQQLGDLALASQSYETILQRQPNNPDALSALGGVRFQQQRLTEAETLYQQVLSLKPGDRDTQRILAELSVAQDQPLEAIARFQQLRQTQSTPAPIVRRIQDLQVDLLRRRGFQPSWERY